MNIRYSDNPHLLRRKPPKIHDIDFMEKIPTITIPEGLEKTIKCFIENGNPSAFSSPIIIPEFYEQLDALSDEQRDLLNQKITSYMEACRALRKRNETGTEKSDIITYTVAGLCNCLMMDIFFLIFTFVALGLRISYSTQKQQIANEQEQRFLDIQNYLKTRWEIEAGPRNKLLVTNHLEYVIYALLDKPTNAKFEHDTVGNIHIIINRKKINFTELLKANPDYEQLFLNKLHSRAYLYSVKKKNIESSHGHLSDAENMAIYEWSTSKYTRYNQFLRYFRIGPYIHDILDICFASCGITKDYSPHRRQTYFISYRGENSGDYLNERKQCALEKKVVMNRGFTASSISHSISTIFGSVRTTFFQPNSINPMGKNITELSKDPTEREILFIPGAEFKYTIHTGGFIATPVRPALPVDEEKYTALNQTRYSRSFSSEHIVELFLHKANSMMSLICQDLHGAVLNCKAENVKKIQNVYSEIKALEIKESNAENIFDYVINLIKCNIKEPIHANHYLSDALEFVEHIKNEYIILKLTLSTKQNIGDRVNTDNSRLFSSSSIQRRVPYHETNPLPLRHLK